MFGIIDTNSLLLLLSCSFAHGRNIWRKMSVKKLHIGFYVVALNDNGSKLCVCVLLLEII